ncbi:zinc-binding dehydrogenase [Variovorax defluvii]|uniref:Zinc-binding dehydrogenase n=1 Tax=Variovorax defluvii TaxID=913761 RepID=A0ABP8I8X4_9BURK
MSFDDPKPGPDEIIVQMKASGFCGSDLHHYRGPRGASLQSRSDAFLAERGLKRTDPIIAGHEPCGVVVELGKNVDPMRMKVGDRVLIYHYDGCGYCDQCRSGWVVICDGGSTIYGQNAHGGHAHFIKVPAKAAIHLPDEISFSAGAAISCGMGTAFAALERLELSGRDTLAVFGMGPVGQSAVQLAKAMGVRTVAVDISPQRVAQALEFGATHAIDSSKADAVEAILQWTGGRGVTVALDTAGVASARQAAVRSSATWGRIGFVGVGGGVSLDVTPDLILKQRSIVGHLTFSDVGLTRCVRFIADHGVDVDRQFSHRWKLEDADEAYREFDKQTAGKAVFEF